MPLTRSRTQRALQRVAVGALSALLAAVVAGCSANGAGPQPSPIPAGTTAATTATSMTDTTPAPTQPANGALAALAALPVKGRAPMTGYERDRFGPAWSDVDRNGCDTRNDVLRRDLTGTTLDPRTHGCVVLTGTLHDPYSGRVIAFVRGQTTSAEVQIDHIVSVAATKVGD